jgi:hypothetical protein
MRLIEVLEESATDSLQRRIASLEAIMNDPAATAGERENARLLKDNLERKRASSIPTVETVLIQVLQNMNAYCEPPYYGAQLWGLNWIRFIEFLTSALRPYCTIVGRSPTSGDYSISMDYSRRIITISYNSSYMKVASPQHFIGKLLFADLKPIVERMVATSRAA